MSGLRKRLIEMLQEHPTTDDGCRCGGDEHLAYHYCARHVADAVLSLPGIAIVELPDPSYVDEPDQDLPGYGFNGAPSDSAIAAEHGVYAHGGLVYDQYDGLTPAQARTVASWWLAAAAAAEQRPNK